MGLAMVCEACQKNRHENCGNPAACICAFRGHPEVRKPGDYSANSGLPAQ